MGAFKDIQHIVSSGASLTWDHGPCDGVMVAMFWPPVACTAREASVPYGGLAWKPLSWGEVVWGCPAGFR